MQNNEEYNIEFKLIKINIFFYYLENAIIIYKMPLYIL